VEAPVRERLYVRGGIADIVQATNQALSVLKPSVGCPGRHIILVPRRQVPAEGLAMLLLGSLLSFWRQLSVVVGPLRFQSSWQASITDGTPCTVQTGSSRGSCCCSITVGHPVWQLDR
jgi:hypothetical protein